VSMYDHDQQPPPEAPGRRGITRAMTGARGRAAAVHVAEPTQPPAAGPGPGTGGGVGHYRRTSVFLTDAQHAYAQQAA
jgi:hypothetical protein